MVIGNLVLSILSGYTVASLFVILNLNVVVLTYKLVNGFSICLMSFINMCGGFTMVQQKKMG